MREFAKWVQALRAWNFDVLCLDQYFLLVLAVHCPPRSCLPECSPRLRDDHSQATGCELEGTGVCASQIGLPKQRRRDR
jgi:hypothetical protein